MALRPDEVRFWIKEMESCEKRQQEELIERNLYPYLINYYEGDMGPTGDEGLQPRDSETRVAFINEYFPNVNQLVNEIVYKYPEFVANATKPEAEEQAPIMQGGLTYGMKQLDSLTEMRLATFDMIMAGLSCVEVNHINIPETGVYLPRDFKDGDDRFQDKGILAKVKGFIGANDKEEVKFESKIDPKEFSYATKDQTYLRRWNPLDCPIDYRATRLKDIRYTVKKIRMSHAEFAARYPKFANKVQAETENIAYCNHTYLQYKKTVLLYEIQRKLQGEKYDTIIINKTYPNGEIDQFERPYVHRGLLNGFNLKYGILHNYGKIYPISMAKINKAVQDDINNYLSHWQEVAERTVPKYVAVRGSMKADSMAAAKSANVGDIIPLDRVTDLQAAPQLEVSEENKEILIMRQQASERGWTLPKQRTAQQGSKDQLATDIELQEAGFQVGLAGIQLGVKKLWLQCADALKDIIAQFWDQPMWFKVTGGQMDWYEPEIDPMTGTVRNSLAEILSMDYEIDLDIISAMRPNKEQKKRETLEAATWALSPQLIEALLNPATTQYATDIAKRVFNELGWNADALMASLQPPEQEQGVPIGQPVVPGVV